MIKKYILNNNLFYRKIQENPIQKKNNDPVLDDWECPICYSELGNNIGILFPYKCDHALCFDCFTKVINHSRKEGKSPLKTTCSLCRASVCDRWKINEKATIKYCISINYKNYKLYVC